MPAQQRRGRPVWFPRLTVRGGMFLVTGAPLLLYSLVSNQRDLLFVACLLLVVPVVAVAYVSVRPVRLQVTRTFHPPVVAAGGETTVALTLCNLSSRAVTGLRWRDAAPEALAVPPGATLPVLDRFEGGAADGADTVHLDYRVTPRRRGVYPCGPALIGQPDPFGLTVGEWTVGEPQDLVVTPRVTDLAGRGLESVRGDGEVPERLRHVHHNSDQLIAREYRPGDQLRRVNWPATARHGEIMVRQEEEQSKPRARLVFDTALHGRRKRMPDPGGHQGLRHDPAFDVAVELVASVGAHLLEAGYQLDLIELGPGRLAPASARAGGGLRGDPGDVRELVFREPGEVRSLLVLLAGIEPPDPDEPADPDEPPDPDEPADTHEPAATPGPASAAGATRPADAAGATGRPRMPLSPLGRMLPTFAVLVDIDAQDTDELAHLASRSRSSVAFVLDPMNPESVARLRDAGWRCVRLQTARDIPGAWVAAVGERQAADDGA
ncbi:DUF58 domain-containing protein [Cryobacterium shii]|uniref:DUF58 domain-containing protein n=1 Tax=Cryobacterium shii TaxID=1259235 RepID=A0AAQ2C398_9MICO|nr:DUF58 domain-containing protein [Cryobacterium shii]TFC40985.1 DUF58 domain-containing protein [Cryobacterium shii]